MSACRFCTATIFWRYVDGRATPYDSEDKKHSCIRQQGPTAPQYGAGKPITKKIGPTAIGPLYDPNVKHQPGCYTLPWVSCDCPELVRWRERAGVPA